MKKKKIAFLVLLCLSGTFIYNQLKPPKRYNSIENNYKKLKPIGKINVELGNKEYLFSPWAIAYTSENIHVFDDKQAKMFVFNKKENFLKFDHSYGKRGQGPGDFIEKSYVYTISNKGNVYVWQSLSQRLSIFNKEGKFLHCYNYFNEFNPQFAVLEDGSILFVDSKDPKTGFLELYKFTDREFKKFKINSECSDKLMEINCQGIWGGTGLDNIPIDTVSQNKTFNEYRPHKVKLLKFQANQLIMFFVKSATALLINVETKKYKKITFWPKDVWGNHQKRLQSFTAKSFYKQKGKKLSVVLISRPSPWCEYCSINTDSKTQNSIILHAIFHEKEKKWMRFYHFDLNGKLQKIAYLDKTLNSGGSFVFLGIYNGIYYLMNSQYEIIILKEEL